MGHNNPQLASTCFFLLLFSFKTHVKFLVFVIFSFAPTSILLSKSQHFSRIIYILIHPDNDGKNMQSCIF